ncbi:P-loop containing nucleoside triphosphate hydrolase protein [Pavlovales sp. CCMP2436]|nr:P-loop containing nucleoside triphosphate hydrolase protein [Pavlovales sp. CCMP2436]
MCARTSQTLRTDVRSRPGAGRLENEEGNGEEGDGEEDERDIGEAGDYDEPDIGDDDPRNFGEDNKTAVRQFLGLGAEDELGSEAWNKLVDALVSATGVYAFQSSAMLEVLLHWSRVLSGEIDLPAGVVLPTGSGKSYLIARICALMSLRAKEADADAEGEGGEGSLPKVLVLSPNKEINKGLKKVLKEAIANAGCERQLFVLSRRKQIGGKLYANAGVVLTNYHVLAQGKDDVLQTYQAELGQFDTLIIDEGHHRAACSYEHILRHFKPKFVLFLSACFLRGDGVEVKCTIVFRRELQWAVDKKLIAEPSIQNLVIKDMLLHTFKDGHEESAEQRSEVKKSKEKAALFDNSELHEQIAQSMTSQLILMRERTKLQRLVGLVKAASVAQAKMLVKIYGECEYKWTNAAGNSQTRKIRVAKYTAGTGKRYLEQFEKGEIDVLVVVGKLSEGYDFPPISVLAWHYPTTSVICALQFLGRALRWIKPEYSNNQPLADSDQVCVTIVPKVFNMDPIWKTIGRTVQIHEKTIGRSNKLSRKSTKTPSARCIE